MLTAQLTGGLGNQLFTYSRLALHARMLDTPLLLDGSITERVLGQKADIFEFNLMGEMQITASDYGRLGSQLERAIWRWKLTRTIFRRFQGTLLGNQDNLAPVAHRWKIRGFFQDYQVAEEFLEIFSKKPLSLKTETESLQKFSERIRGVPTLAIHMRRGDYLDYKDSFGVLSDTYYLDAVKIISMKTTFQKVLIFTDSPEITDQICKEIPISTEVVTANDLSTCETLVLMSRCDGIVTSNSTYSFWAAILASHENVVIPSPWFKSDDSWLNSSNFDKPNWMKCQSKWID